MMTFPNNVQTYSRLGGAVLSVGKWEGEVCWSLGAIHKWRCNIEQPTVT